MHFIVSFLFTCPFRLSPAPGPLHCEIYNGKFSKVYFSCVQSILFGLNENGQTWANKRKDVASTLGPFCFGWVIYFRHGACSESWPATVLHGLKRCSIVNFSRSWVTRPCLISQWKDFHLQYVEFLLLPQDALSQFLPGPTRHVRQWELPGLANSCDVIYPVTSFALYRIACQK